MGEAAPTCLKVRITSGSGRSHVIARANHRWERPLPPAPRRESRMGAAAPTSFQVRITRRSSHSHLLPDANRDSQLRAAAPTCFQPRITSKKRPQTLASAYHEQERTLPRASRCESQVRAATPTCLPMQSTSGSAR